MSEATSLVMPGTENAAEGALPEGAAPLADIDPTEPALEPDGQSQAFDSGAFRIDVPEVDGVDADKIVVAFAGSVELDLHNEHHLSFFNSLTLGKDVELRAAGTVSDKLSPLKVDSDGKKTMVRKAKISVTDVYVLAPEDL